MYCKLTNKTELNRGSYICLYIRTELYDKLETHGMLQIKGKPVLFKSTNDAFDYAELNLRSLRWFWDEVQKEEVNEEVYLATEITEEDIRQSIDIRLSEFGLSNYDYQITKISDRFYRILFTPTLMEIELNGNKTFLRAEDNNPHSREEINFISSVMSDLEQLYIE